MEDGIVKNVLIDEHATYLQLNSMDNKLNNSVTKVTVLAIFPDNSPENDSLPLLESGGVSVAVILALGIFVGILLDKINTILKSLK
jgi:hypothetical protein